LSKVTISIKLCFNAPTALPSGGKGRADTFATFVIDYVKILQSPASVCALSVCVPVANRRRVEMALDFIVKLFPFCTSRIMGAASIEFGCFVLAIEGKKRLGSPTCYILSGSF
jgi:hypothetical protein